MNSDGWRPRTGVAGRISHFPRLLNAVRPLDAAGVRLIYVSLVPNFVGGGNADAARPGSRLLFVSNTR